MTDEIPNDNDSVELGQQDTLGIGGASARELTLVLEVMQQAGFPTWEQKILAGQVQRRVDFTLKQMPEFS